MNVKPHRRTALLFVLVLTTLMLSACGGNESDVAADPDLSAETQVVSVAGGGSYTDVTPAGLSLMLANKDFPLINVHVPYEGEITKTDAFIVYSEISQHLDQLPANKDEQIVLYCRSGNMSTQAARELAQLGYTNVWNLDGGMIAWQVAGYVLTNNP